MADVSQIQEQDSSKETTKSYKYMRFVEWRAVHRKLQVFVRCVDFMVMELLKRLVTNSVSDIVLQIEASVNKGEKPKSRTIDWIKEKENANRITTSIFEEPPKIVSTFFELNLILSEARPSVKKRSARQSGRGKVLFISI